MNTASVTIRITMRQIYAKILHFDREIVDDIHIIENFIKISIVSAKIFTGISLVSTSQ